MKKKSPKKKTAKQYPEYFDALLNAVWFMRWTKNRQAMYAVLEPKEAEKIAFDIPKELRKAGFAIVPIPLPKDPEKEKVCTKASREGVMVAFLPDRKKKKKLTPKQGTSAFLVNKKKRRKSRSQRIKKSLTE